MISVESSKLFFLRCLDFFLFFLEFLFPLCLFSLVLRYFHVFFQCLSKFLLFFYADKRAKNVFVVLRVHCNPDVSEKACTADIGEQIIRTLIHTQRNFCYGGV